MTVIPLVLSVAAAVLLYVCLSHWVRRERTVLGLKNAVIVSADDSTQGMSTLCSKRYGLVGRPDQLIRVGRMLIPVEQKPTARRMQQLHVLQLAAQCLLVQEVYGVRPSHGLLVLAGGKQERVHTGARGAVAPHHGADACAAASRRRPWSAVGRGKVPTVRLHVRPAGVLSIEAALYATMN